VAEAGSNFPAKSCQMAVAVLHAYRAVWLKSPLHPCRLALWAQKDRM